MNKTTMPEPGIYYDVSAEDYFSWNCFHKSWVSATLKSPKHLKLKMEEDKKTEPMIIGSLVDALVLDAPERDNFEILPDTYINAKDKEMPFTMRSNSCKKMHQDIIDKGMMPITNEQFKKAQTIRDGIFENPVAAEWIKSMKKQVAIVWDDPETGIRCKARLDGQMQGFIADLKTSRDASPFSFARDAARLGYHTQAGMYIDGWKQLNPGANPKWNFIVVENEAPYCCAVYELDEESIDAGRIRYRMALAKYEDYMESDPGLTRGYSIFVEPIRVPEWEINSAYKDAEDSDVGI